MTEKDAIKTGRPEAPSLPRKVIAQTFVSLDGVMQAPGGPDEDRQSGFRHGGWSMTLWDETMVSAMGEFMANPHDLLLGRVTYDIFAAYWPSHRSQPGASSLNEATKYVASRSQRSLSWENSYRLDGDLADAVRKLKSGGGRDLHVLGSSDLLQTLLKNDLVDELSIWIFPVVIGSGKRLFGSGAIPSAWKLMNARTSGTGVQMLEYKRSGPITYGTAPGT